MDPEEELRREVRRQLDAVVGENYAPPRRVRDIVGKWFAAAVLALERPPPGPDMRRPAAANDGPDRKAKNEPQQHTTSARRLQEVSNSWGSA